MHDCQMTIALLQDQKLKEIIDDLIKNKEKVNTKVESEEKKI